MISYNRSNSVSGSHRRGWSQVAQAQQEVGQGAQPRIYALTPQEAQESNVITGTLLFQQKLALVLFDSGTTHHEKTVLSKNLLELPFMVKLPNGSHTLVRYYVEGNLEINDNVFKV